MTTARATVAALLLATLLGCAEDRTPELVFKAPVARLPRSMQQAYGSLSPGDSVEIRLAGEWFDPPRRLRVITRDAADLSSPLSASEAAYSAFKHYDDEWILASFAEADREDIRGFLGDSAVRAGSRGYYEEIQAQHVHGVANYVSGSTQYRLVFVTLHHTDTSLRMEAFVLEDGEWRKTNQLARERDFQVAWNAYRHGRVTPK